MRQFFPYIRRQFLRIAVFGVFFVVQCDFDDIFLFNAACKQVFIEQIEEQIALPAPADARDDLDQPVFFLEINSFKKRSLLMGFMAMILFQEVYLRVDLISNEL